MSSKVEDMLLELALPSPLRNKQNTLYVSYILEEHIPHLVYLPCNMEPFQL